MDIMHIELVTLINVIADGLCHLHGPIFTVQTLQDCGSSAAFMSQCGPSQDPSSCIQINAGLWD